MVDLSKNNGMRNDVISLYLEIKCQSFCLLARQGFHTAGQALFSLITLDEQTQCH